VGVHLSVSWCVCCWLQEDDLENSCLHFCNCNRMYRFSTCTMEFYVGEKDESAMTEMHMADAHAVTLLCLISILFKIIKYALEAFLICLYSWQEMSLEIIIQKWAKNYCCSNGKPDYTIKVACMVILC